MTISQAQIDAMDECMEFGAMHNREPLNDLHRRNLSVVPTETPNPTEPFEDIAPESPTWGFPTFVLIVWLAVVAFWSWKDSGFPPVFPQ